MKTVDDGPAKALLAQWEEQLSQVEDRRAELLTGINLIRKDLGLPPTQEPDEASSTAVAAKSSHVKSDASKPFLGMNILDAAKAFLDRVKEPRTPTDIADAIKSGGVHSRSVDFSAIVRTTLSRGGKDYGIESFGDGTWGLRQWRPGGAKTQQGEAEG